MQKSSAYTFIASAGVVFALAKCFSGPAPTQIREDSEATKRYAEIKQARESARVNSADLTASFQTLNDLGLSDKALLACVQQAVEYALAHTGGHTVSQPTDIETLDCAGKNVYRLDGLRHFKMLRELNLARNHIDNLEPISALEQLEVLDLGQNEITSIWPILSLDQLQTLTLTGNKIGDLQHLNGFEKLNKLNYKLSSQERCDYLVNIKRALQYSQATLAVPSRCVDEFGEPANISEFE